MRMALLLGAMVIVMVAGGCTERPSGKPAVPFSLDVQPRKLELRKGEALAKDVVVNWDKGEREDLQISVSLAPEGPHVSARVEKAVLERGVGPAQVSFSATETAAPGDYVLTITAKGARSGATAKTSLTITVPRGE